MQTVPRPAATNVALFGLPTFAACVELTRLARQQLGEILSAVEMVDAATMDTTVEQLMSGDAGAYPLPSRPPFYVVMETGGSVAEHDTAKLHAFLEAVAAGGALGADGVGAADSRRARALWRVGGGASVGVSRRGHTYKYDLSFPLPAMYDLVAHMRSYLEVERGWAARAGVRVVGYGHLGDGNIHLNISTRDRAQPYHAELLADIEPRVFDWTLAHGGSVSAEHGLGQAKAALLPAARPPPVVALMTALKAVMDPAHILNPGKVLPTAAAL